MKQLSHDSELIRLTREINEAQDCLDDLKAKAITGVNSYLTECILQGQRLIHAKARIPFGYWLDWLRGHCPKSISMAHNYMKLAMRWQKASELSEAGTLRAALAMCNENRVTTETEAQRWPAYMEAIGRLSRLVGYMQRFPVDQWPEEGSDKFRRELEPIAAQLWPDKFNDEPTRFV